MAPTGVTCLVVRGDVVADRPRTIVNSSKTGTQARVFGRGEEAAARVPLPGDSRAEVAVEGTKTGHINSR